MKLSVLMPVGGVIETEPWRWRSFEWLSHRYAELLPEAELVFGVSDQEPFNRSQARNNAYAKSTGDILLVADADTIFHAGQIHRAINAIMFGDAPWVIPYAEDRYYNLSQRATSYVIGQHPGTEIPEPQDEDLWDHKITSWAGLLVLPRTAWETVGGYDERFIGWGYDDNAFRFALDRVVGPHHRIGGPSGFCMHAWHPAPEEECFGQPHIQENRKLCRQYEIGDLPR